MASNPYYNRRYVIGGIAIGIILLYILRLLSLQLMSDNYKKNADSNAFRKEILYPSRGLIFDRTGKLLVYNEPSYNIMVTMNDQKGVDTLDFCKTLGITKQEYIERCKEIKDRRNNPGYSRYTPQAFLTQIPPAEFAIFREKLFRFNGFSVEKRSTRCYATNNCAHILGEVGEAGPKDLEKDSYYQVNDFLGKLGVERSYEKQLRGVKGLRIMLRDVRGRTKGHYQGGKYDTKPIAGKNLTLSIDLKLQELAERLLQGKLGAIVAIEPSTGQVLCMASSPTYNPNIMVGRMRGKSHMMLRKNPMKPMLNRAIMGMYPPGSTFKISQALIGLQEGSITPQTSFPCHRGFNYKGLHVGCHSHPSPLSLIPAIATSCNSYFCWNLYKLLSNKKKYGSVQNALTIWKNHLVKMGFGYKLGIDLPGEKRGMIPNAQYYDKVYKKHWNGLTVISIAIGQGEVTATPLQICNLAASVANRGFYYIPHVVERIQNGKLDNIYLQRHYTGIAKKWYDYAVAGMRKAVLTGTCKKANLPDIEVCGKTGTAQNRGHDHSVFMGFAPMKNPKIAVAVYVENGGFGDAYGVPIGALIMEQYINGHLSAASEAKATMYQNRSISYKSGK